MKNWLILVSIILSFPTLATQFINGKQYVLLEKNIVDRSHILEFFSFYCLHCFQLEKSLYSSNGINKSLLKNIKVTKYHVEFLGPLGKELTKAWAVAIALGVEDKIIKPMFKAIQTDHIINTTDDIRKVFINAGVNGKDYDIAWNSFLIKFIINKQEKLASYLNLQSVPAVFINGKYQINPQELDVSNIDNFIKQYIELIKYLIKK